MITKLRGAMADHPTVVALLRVAMTAGLLVFVCWWIDLEVLHRSLREADAGWLALALVLSVPQLMLVAWRWSFTATRLGVPLPFVVAWREYYLSALLNTVLPGGVLGDVTRVARHARLTAHPLGPVVRAAVVERVVGQTVQWLVLVVTAAIWGLGDLLIAAVATVAVVTVVAVGIAVGPGSWLARVRQDLRAALLQRTALAIQLSTSLGSVLLLVGMFYACAAGVHSSLRPTEALVIVPWILAATVLPITVGGWGIRELGAAATFSMIGLRSAEGAASSVVFGAVTLVSVLPGLVPLVRSRRSR